MAKQARHVDPSVVTAHESRPAAADPDETRIAALAYQFWLERGGPIGSDQEDWFRAERMLKSRSENVVEELVASARSNHPYL